MPYRHMKMKSPYIHFIIQNIFDKKMNVYSLGVLHSYSIKNILYDEMEFRLFYFHVAICFRVFN